MKKLLKLLSILFFAAVFSSCEKDDAVVRPEEQAKGYWRGTIIDLDNNYQANIALLFKEKGAVRFYNMFGLTDTTASGTQKTDGVYIVSGQTVAIDLAGFYLDGYMDNSFRTIIGTVIGSGTYTLYKQ
jgi:hypothetical protein